MMIRRLLSIFLMMSVVGACADTPSSETEPSSTVDEGGQSDSSQGDSDSVEQPTGLEASLLPSVEAAVAAGLPGVIVYARKGGEEALFARGLADIDAAVAMRPDHAFRIASNSKTYLGVLAAKLHARGDFSLDTPIKEILTAEIIDGIANAQLVTTRQLLNHTTGIPDYYDSDEIWDEMLDNPDHRWTAVEALAYIDGKPAEFEPDAQHGYSNSNYLLAGLVVDKVTGAHHSAAIKSEILDAAGLSSTYYEHHAEAVGELCHGYGDYIGDSGLDDTYAVDLGYGLADGGMVSTVQDLAGLYDKINDGTLLDASGRSAMLDNGISADGAFAGLGIFTETDEGAMLWTHGGANVGYLSDILYYPESGDALVFFANGSEGNLDDAYDDFYEAIWTAFSE